MSEDERENLLYIIEETENDIEKLRVSLEDNYDINKTDWKVFDLMIGEINYDLHLIKDKIF